MDSILVTISIFLTYFLICYENLMEGAPQIGIKKKHLYWNRTLKKPIIISNLFWHEHNIKHQKYFVTYFIIEIIICLKNYHIYWLYHYFSLSECEPELHIIKYMETCSNIMPIVFWNNTFSAVVHFGCGYTYSKIRPDTSWYQIVLVILEDTFRTLCGHKITKWYHSFRRYI